jgi:hypothetical protein
MAVAIDRRDALTTAGDTWGLGERRNSTRLV